MKRFLRMICLLLSAVLLVSCAGGTDARAAMFDDRAAEPMHMETTVGQVQFTVTMDRCEYALGDDMDITVSAKNVGAESLTVEVDQMHPIENALSVVVRVDGEALKCQILQEPTARVASHTVQWAVGETLTNHGRCSTSDYCEELKAANKIELVVAISGREECLEIPLTIHTDLPQDDELAPYREQGLITEALYARARTMNSNETIYVLVPDVEDNIWKQNAESRSISYTSHYREEEWTREQLLDYLKTHSSDLAEISAPLEYLFAQWPSFWLAGYTLDETFDLVE